MFCNKCGTKNPDASLYCSKCGEKLNVSLEEQIESGAQAPAEKLKKRKAGLLTGLIAGGVVVAAAAVALVLLFSGKARPVTGDWYSKERSETMAFYADGIVLVANEKEEVKGAYKYDERSGQGVINVNNTDIPFSVEGDVLTFSDDITARFVRFDGGATIVGIIPTPPPDTSAGAVQPPSETTAGATMTEEPAAAATPTPAPAAPTPHTTPHPTHHATPTPAPTPSVTLGTPPTPPPSPTPSPIIIVPIIIDNSDVTGEWLDEMYHGIFTLSINADNTYTQYWTGSVVRTGTYQYYPLTLEGTFKDDLGTKANFYLSSDKQRLNWDGTWYYRPLK